MTGSLATKRRLDVPLPGRVARDVVFGLVHLAERGIHAGLDGPLPEQPRAEREVALPGDTIALAPGATFTGNFTLPARIGDAVHHHPNGRGCWTAGRWRPRLARQTLARWRSSGQPGAAPAIRTAAGATTGG